MATDTVARPTDPTRSPPPETAQGDVIPDAPRNSPRHLRQRARAARDDPARRAGRRCGRRQIERLIFRAAAPIVQSVAPLTEAQRGELLPNIVRLMLAAFLEEHGR
jgi:hypothetical protein